MTPSTTMTAISGARARPPRTNPVSRIRASAVIGVPRSSAYAKHTVTGRTQLCHRLAGLGPRDRDLHDHLVHLVDGGRRSRLGHHVARDGPVDGTGQRGDLAPVVADHDGAAG